MKYAVLIALATCLISSAALAQSLGEKTGINPALGIAPTTADFVKQTAISDMTEIAAAKIALEKGSPDEKKFAEQMVTDHSKTSSELKALVTGGEVTAEIPATLDSPSQKKIDRLTNATPADFAAEYDPMQINAHKDAVSLFERYSRGGDNPALRAWTLKTLPHLRHHLEMAQALNKSR
jgi:putative membrane protein